MVKNKFEWLCFEELSLGQLYEMMKVRQEVFVVEQECVYLDADGQDEKAHHLFCWGSASPPSLCGYLRVLAPGTVAKIPAIGRVLVRKDNRGEGLARELMQQAITYTRKQYPGQSISVSAQCYLQQFYTSLGFVEAIEVYDEDGIPHIGMELLP